VITRHQTQNLYLVSFYLGPSVVSTSARVCLPLKHFIGCVHSKLRKFRDFPLWEHLSIGKVFLFSVRTRFITLIGQLFKGGSFFIHCAALFTNILGVTLLFDALVSAEILLRRELFHYGSHLCLHLRLIRDLKKVCYSETQLHHLLISFSL
jgi:hypothetical protein